MEFQIGLLDINDVLWSCTFFDYAYVESRQYLNKNKWNSNPSISFQEAKTTIEEEHEGTRSFINGEYTKASDGKYDTKFSPNGILPRTISVYHRYSIAALPATEDCCHSGTNDYECTECSYPDTRNYTFELIPV